MSILQAHRRRTTAFHPCLPVPLSGRVSPVQTCTTTRRSLVSPNRRAPCAAGVVVRVTPRSSAEPVHLTEWMSAAEFDAAMSSERLALCLVGMSNCGKSHWSTALGIQKGFQVTCVDEEIEHLLKDELTQGGYSGIDGLASWMGFPTDQRFAKAQEKYLAAEEMATQAGAQPTQDSNCVLDTTGSVVYLNEATCSQVRNNFLVIHLEAGDDMLAKMTERFFETPKPVVWGDSFDWQEGENEDEAMRRCYPNLLRQRRERYRKLAHVNVAAGECISPELCLDGFLDLVKQQMRD